MGSHGVYPHDIIPPKSGYYDSGRFGRLFGSLPSFASDTPQTRKALLDIGRPGGIMDAADDLSQTPADLIINPTLSQDNPDNPDLTAGFTFFGQFLDHDMTFDPTSSLERQVDPEQISNFRTPSLALDSIYGAGPGGSPHLYDASAGKVSFLVEVTGTPGKEDLPRNSQNCALIGDPRNDENLIISQLQLAFLKFHNVAVEYVKNDIGLTQPNQIFAEAQRLVRWHYQWIVVHEFLPKTCGQAVVDDVLTNGRSFYKWHNEPYIPVEFSVGAYRFGHSQIRPSYRANFTGNPGGQPFFGMIFTASPSDPIDPDDLSGGCRAPRRFIDWPTFFNLGDGHARQSKRIDTTLSSALFSLPASVVANPDPMLNPSSLAQRNLLRHLTFALPAGQRVAKAMSLPVLSKGDLSDLAQHGMDDRTPLWFYILREASVIEDGRRLGPVGARIVAEVFIGLLEGDKLSYLSQEPDWEPSFPTIVSTDTGDNFSIIDMLRFAGVA